MGRIHEPQLRAKRGRHWPIQGDPANLRNTPRVTNTKGLELFQDASWDPARPNNCLAADQMGKPFKNHCACPLGYYLEGTWPSETCTPCWDPKNGRNGQFRTTLPPKITRGSKGYQSCIMCNVSYYGSFNVTTPCIRCPVGATTIDDDRRQVHDCTCTTPGQGLDRDTKTCRTGPRTAPQRMVAAKASADSDHASIDAAYIGVIVVMGLIIVGLCGFIFWERSSGFKATIEDEGVEEVQMTGDDWQM